MNAGIKLRLVGCVYSWTALIPSASLKQHICSFSIWKRNINKINSKMSAEHSIKLTDQQRAIVEHFDGPALVFAVAGSGKTTSMVHRIARLIKHHQLEPSSILATSFNAAAAREISQQLADIGVPAGVDCRTLHSLGYKIIQGAARRGLVAQQWLKRRDQGDGQDRLINRVLTAIAIERGEDLSELNIDREELKNQISVWKGNLVYPDPERAGLPLAALEIAEKAVHGNRLFLDAYQKFETLRQEEFLLTFDDMLMMAWQLLVTHGELLKAVQERYQMLMVDEFQDVNRAQYEMIDLISRPHGNYMAIGDDDQCIYEWRGANPAFILEFEKRYQAAVYRISDNFRSSLHQTALANAVIQQNRRRYPKQLSLTRGLAGSASWNALPDEMDVARKISGDIATLLAAGEDYSDFAILIRLYSQTAFLETAFIEAGQPYWIEGAEPFYKRREVVTLLQYLAFAQMEQEIREDGFPTESGQMQKYIALFKAIVNRPRRYLSRDYVAFVTQQAERSGRSLLYIMQKEQDQLRGRSVSSMEDFVHLVNQMRKRLKKNAAKTLGWLVSEIEYRDYLLEISGQREIGITRVQTVTALIRFASSRGNCREFLDYIRGISTRPIGASPKKAIRVLTIYRAKGLEWKTVFVPGCSAGILPCALSESAANSKNYALDVEAERRLFYVAITRAKQHLHLFHAKDRDVSPFVKDVALPELMKAVAAFRDFREKHGFPQSEKLLLQFCRYIGKFHLERYLDQWLDVPLKIGKQRKMTLDRLRSSKPLPDSAPGNNMDHRSEEKGIAQLQSVDLRIKRLKSSMFIARNGDSLFFELYADGEVMVMSDRGLIGTLDMTALGNYPLERVRWGSSSATVIRVSESEQQVVAAFENLVIKPVTKTVETKPVAPKKSWDQDTLRGLQYLWRLADRENNSAGS